MALLSSRNSCWFLTARCRAARRRSDVVIPVPFQPATVGCSHRDDGVPRSALLAVRLKQPGRNNGGVTSNLKPHRVVVVGGGFAGLYAVRGLDDAPVEVTLVDRRNFHLFQPLSY